PIHRREHVRSRRGADVERRQRSAVEPVPDRVPAGAAEDCVEDALYHALVALVAERCERERAIVRGVVADGGRLALRDRHLQTHGAAYGDDLWIRLGRRRERARDGELRDVGRRSPAEGGQCERDDENDGQDGEEREPPSSARGTHLPTFDAPPPAGTRGRNVERHRIERHSLVQPRLDPFQRQSAFRPPGIGPNPADLRDTIARMAAPAATRIVIPRWVQLVGLPLVLLLVWAVAGVVRHAVFLFLVALLIALLLNPLVRGLGRVWIPRGLAIAIVYLAFAAALALAVLALATV